MFMMQIMRISALASLVSVALALPTFTTDNIANPKLVSANVYKVHHNGQITLNHTQSLDLSHLEGDLTHHQKLATRAVYRPGVPYFAGFNVGAYNDAGACKSAGDWVNELRKVKSWSNPNFNFNTVKIFTTSECNSLANAIAAAKQIGGMKVWAGIWASPPSKYQAEKAALEGQIKAGNSYWIAGVSVGSEEMFRGMPASTLSGYVWDIKGMVQNSYGKTGIAIGTSDSIQNLKNGANKAVLDACDVALVTSYPYYGGSSIDTAVRAFKVDWWGLGAMMQGRPLVVGETGWPSSGQTIGQAVASPTNAQRFFRGVACWMKSTKKSFFYFEASNEGWKTESAAESQFGVAYTSGGNLKFGLTC